MKQKFYNKIIGKWKQQSACIMCTLLLWLYAIAQVIWLKSYRKRVLMGLMVVDKNLHDELIARLLPTVVSIMRV